MVIGIDTSGKVCSVAAVLEGSTVAEFSINHKRTHSAMLVPMLDTMLKHAGLDIHDTSLFAVANGPGSFTGLRIGAATAQGLSLALDKPVIGISTLLALSYNLKSSNSLVCPIMDARRNQVYTGVYDYSDRNKKMESIVPILIDPMAIDIRELLDKLNDFGREVVFLGDGVPVYLKFIEQSAKFAYSFAPGNSNVQRASSVALLAELLYKDNAKSKSLKLEYLRRPQAERERLGL